MQLEGISIEQFLSYETFEWANLNPDLNLIVGPNGAGKTNLFHALRAVVYAVSSVRQSDLRWEQAVHRGPPGRLMKISLDLHFAEPRERDLFCTFFGAALWEVLKNQPYFSDVNRHPELSSFLHQYLNPKDIEWLFTGRLVVTYDEAENHWAAWYESRPEAPPFRWTLQGQNQSSYLSGEVLLAPLLQGLTQAWKAYFMPDQLAREAVAAQEDEMVVQPLSETGAMADAPASDDALLPAPPIAELPALEQVQLASKLLASKLDVEASVSDNAQPAAQAVEDSAPLEQAQHEIHPAQTSPPPLFDAERALLATPLGKGFSLRFGGLQGLALATHRAFEQAGGWKIDGNRNFEGSFIFEHLLKQSFIFTDNIRRLPQYTYSLDEVNKKAINLSNGEHLALYLLRKKIGPDQRDRDQYQAIRNTFCTLTRRQFEVVWGSFDPTSTRGGTSTTPGEVRLEIHLTSDQGDIPLEFSGAGLFEALFLSTLLVSSEGQVLLLDEPALNLHPTMQAVLLRQIQAHSQNQSFVITHSPFLVPPEVMTRVSRLYTDQRKTHIARLNPLQIQKDHLEALEKELRRSADARGMLFSQAVILLEGETELGALPVWFERQFGYSLESRVIQLYSVGGEQGFETYIRFLQQFAIPWVLICDGPVINNQERAGLRHQLAQAGVAGLPDLQRLMFREQCQALMPFGVFTLATDEHQEFEDLPLIQKHQPEAKALYGRSKARRGRYIAQNYPPRGEPLPDEIIGFLQRLAECLKLNGK